MKIQQFLQDYSIPYILRGKNLTPGMVGCNCPFCGDTNYHGAFSPDGRRFYCWRCSGNSVSKTLRAMTGLSWQEYNKVIEDYDGTGALHQNLNKTAKGSNLVLPGIPLIPYDRKYLKKRGFDPEYLAEKYGLKSGGIVGDWAFRILIPVYYKGKLVTWQGRDTTGNEERIRYKTLSIEKSVMNPKSVLFNLDNCKQDRIMVVEGPFDAMRLGDDSCATLGTSMTEAQCRLLSKYTHIYFVFDDEAPAQARAKKFAEQVAALSGGSEGIVVNLELGDRDAGDLTEQEVRDLRKELDFPV